MELTDEKAAVTDLCGISSPLALDFSLDVVTLKVFNIAIFITAPVLSLPFFRVNFQLYLSSPSPLSFSLSHRSPLHLSAW